MLTELGRLHSVMQSQGRPDLHEFVREVSRGGGLRFQLDEDDLPLVLLQRAASCRRSCEMCP